MMCSYAAPMEAQDKRAGDWFKPKDAHGATFYALSCAALMMCIMPDAQLANGTLRDGPNANAGGHNNRGSLTAAVATMAKFSMVSSRMLGNGLAW